MAGWQLPERPVLPAVTGVRFFAAIHVCLYHLGQAAYTITYYGREDTKELMRWAQDVWAILDCHWVVNHILRGALCEVGMFFVMSGFILTYSHPVGPNGEFSLRSYFLSRVSRVYATYLAGLLWGIPLLIFVLSGEPERIREENTKNGIPQPTATQTPTGMRVTPLPPEFTHTPLDKVLALITTPLLLQAWFPKLTVFMWNPPAWSLSVEAFLYALFPLIILRLMRWKTRSLIALGVVCYIAMLIPPIWYVVADPDKTGMVDWNMITFWFNFVRHNPLLRVPEFVMGMIAGRLYSDQAAKNAMEGKGTGAWMSMGALVVMITTLIFSENIFGHDLSYMLLHNGLLAPVFAVGVTGLALGGGPLAKICSGKWMVILGDSAYGIYLFHLPYAMYQIGIMSTDAKADPPKPLPGAWQYIIINYLLVTVLAAVFFRMKLEKPLRLRIKALAARLWPDPNKKAVPAATV